MSDTAMFGSNYIEETDPAVIGALRLVQQADADYPPAFRYFTRMPTAFYLLGALPDPLKKTVAIVGARACSAYGKAQAVHFGRALAKSGVQVVSGMAAGVDGFAMRGALSGGGQAFAVLGTGANLCYPRENYDLYRALATGSGGILTEFAPGSPPEAWHFPIRNRLISALADLVLVVEARPKSGSLITADRALEQGKAVFAVPGRNGDALSQGCNRLIAQGAGIATSPAALLVELGLTPPKQTGGTHADKRKSLPPQFAHAKDFQIVYPCLDSEPHSLDWLVSRTGLGVGALSSVLLQLCLSGYAKEISPGHYVRT